MRTTGGWKAAAAAVFTLASAPVQADKTCQTRTPQVSCAGAAQASSTLQVCGGAAGARAGFSVQWMKTADYAANGSAWYTSDDPRLCKASFSGRAHGSRYDLGPGECVTVNLGNLLFDNGASTNCGAALACGTEYVFRSFAHATGGVTHSAFTANLSCSTLACGDTGGGCTNPQNYWRYFNPLACAAHPESVFCIDWPVTSLTLGTVSYTVEQLVTILNTPASDNGLIALAHQVIAAKLSMATGADGSAVAATIAGADNLIGGLVVPPVGGDSLTVGVTAAYTTSLAAYNEGAIGPGVCPEPDPGQDG